MLELESWMDACAAAVERAFGDRVRCIGLQGSRGRGEAGPDSDIDVVLVLDVLMAEDLDRYEAVLDTLPHRELVCGFVSGWEELRRWERGDLFQLLSDTRVCRGSLDGLRELVKPEDVRRAVLTGACGLYHACVHNRLHERDPELLRQLGKSVFFTLRAKHYAETGRFLLRRDQLAGALPPEERALLEAFGREDFHALSRRLLDWSGALIRSWEPEGGI